MPTSARRTSTELGWIVALLASAACGSSDEPVVARDARGGTVGFVAPAPPVPPPPPFDIAPPSDKLIGVGRGSHHACVVRASGAVDCWGERGDTRSHAPVRVPGVGDAIAIAADGRCVVRKTGQAACLAGDAFAFAPVAGITGATAVDDRSRCYIVGGGSVACVDDGGKPRAVTNVRDAVALAAGVYTTCAIRKTGQVMCGDFASRRWKLLQGIDRVTAMAYSGGPISESQACFATADRVRCLGVPTFVPETGTLRARAADDDGTSYDLPDPDRYAGATHLAMWFDSASVHFEAVVGGKVIHATNRERGVEIRYLADAAIHVPQCAIRAQGSLACWGDNRGGVLGQPTTIGRVVPPTKVVGVGDVVDLAIGLSKTAVLTGDGRVMWWGKRGWDSVTVPTPLALGLGPIDLVQITADHEDHICMRGKAGDVWCQVAYNDGRIEQLDTERAIDIHPAPHTVVAIRDGGRVEAHAISDDRGYFSPMTVSLLDDDIVEIVNVYDLRCSRRRDGTVRCPKAVATITRATRVAGGRDHACAVEDARAWCWTFDEDGYGGPREPREPVEIAGLRDVTDIASSADAACAIHDGGRVSCWRYDEDSNQLPVARVLDGGAIDVELGLASDTQYKNPVSPHNAPPAGAYGCAIMADRTVTCWGRNVHGEIGDGSFVATDAPIGIAL